MRIKVTMLCSTVFAMRRCAHAFTLAAAAVVLGTASALGGDCGARPCVVLDVDDLAGLVERGVLDATQREYLLQHHLADAAAAAEPTAQNTTAPTPAEDDVTALTVVSMYLSTANIFYGTSCFLLTVAYVVLFAYTIETPQVQLGVTGVYHYVFHTIAGLLAQTLTSRVLAAGLYMVCCVMPAMAAAIVMFSPGFLDLWGDLLKPVIDDVGERWREHIGDGAAREGGGGDGDGDGTGGTGGNATPAARAGRVDILIAKSIPTKLYVIAAILVGASMLTAGCYMLLGVPFAGIPALFCGALWVLCLLAACFSMRIDAVNAVLGNGVERLAHASAAYSVVMALAAWATRDPVVGTGCLVSALNAGAWSVPVVLYVSIRPDVDLTHARAASVEAVLSFIQQNDDNKRHRAWVLSNTVFFLALLWYAVAIRSWLPLPYASLGLLLSSVAVKADAKWSIAVHLPIAVGLGRACLLMMHIVDVHTLRALAWLAPESVLVWVLTTCLRSFVSVVAVVQMARALHWLTLPIVQWDSRHVETAEVDAYIRTRPGRCVVHVVTVYVTLSALVFLARCEPNYLISFIAFELPALACLGYFARSAVVFSRGAQEVLTQVAIDATWAVLAARVFANSTGLLLVQAVALAAGISVYWHAGEKRGPYGYAVLGVAICATVGARHNSPMLVFVALVALLGLVGNVTVKTCESRRVTLVVLSACALALVQVGFMFERGDITFVEYVVTPWEAAVLRAAAGGVV